MKGLRYFSFFKKIAEQRGIKKGLQGTPGYSRVNKIFCRRDIREYLPLVLIETIAFSIKLG